MTARCRARRLRGSNCRSGSAITPRDRNWCRCWNGCTRCRRNCRCRVTIGFSREMLDAYDARRTRRRGGAAGRQPPRRRETDRGRVRLVRRKTLRSGAAAIRCRWRRWRRPAACARSRSARSTRPASPGARRFVGGGVTAVVAAALAGLAVAPLARRIAPAGLVDIGPAAEAAATWLLEGDAALEGQRPRQTGGVADAGGDVPERRCRWLAALAAVPG